MADENDEHPFLDAQEEAGEKAREFMEKDEDDDKA